MKIIWNKVTWYSKLMAVLLFLIVVPALSFYIGIQYEKSMPAINPIITEYKWPIVEWKQYTSSASNLSFEYPKNWTIKDDEIFTDETESQYAYPHILVCPPDYELSLAPKGNSPSNCIDFVEENELLHPFPTQEPAIRNFGHFTVFMNLAEYPGYPNYYDANIMEDHSNYFIGFKRIGDRFTGIQQTACLPGQSTQCILIFRHVLDSIQFHGNYKKI